MLGRLFAAGLAFFILAGCGMSEKQKVAILHTDFGKIVLEFYPDDAPNHVDTFKRLVREGFYDGVLFHRVVPGFVVQAGDPTTKDSSTPRPEYGAGGSGETLDAEFNERKHLRGTVGMARTTDPNSADSQFYVCLAPKPHLDRKYTVFGRVAIGMEAVDKIAMVETDARDIPIEPVVIDSIRITSRKEAGLEN